MQVQGIVWHNRAAKAVARQALSYSRILAVPKRGGSGHESGHECGTAVADHAMAPESQQRIKICHSLTEHFGATNTLLCTRVPQSKDQMWKNGDLFTWRQNASEIYKKKIATREGLPNLDRWLFVTLPNRFNSGELTITSKEMCKVMEWKLERGKFRPLMHFMKKLDNAQVKEAVELSISHIDADETRVDLAFDALTALKGVGPATASCLLAALRPKHVAFMADEAVVSCGVAGTDGKIKYTTKIYLKFLEAVTIKANELESLRLKQGDDGGEDNGCEWTPQRVSQALWAENTKIQPRKSKKMKRKRESSPSSRKKRKK